MPTSKTEDIFNGKNVSLRDFLLQCACIELNGDGSGPVLREPYNGYQKAIEQLKREFTEEEFEAYKKDRILELKKNLCIDAALLDEYNKMLEKVNNWSPPTAACLDIKKSAIDNLEMGIELDCYSVTSGYYKEEIDRWEKTDYDEFLRQRAKEIKESLYALSRSNDYEIDTADHYNARAKSIYDAIIQTTN